jgi:hypothetical protein
VVVTIGIYAMLIMGMGETEPTKLTTEAGAMEPLAIPGSPRSVVPAGSGGDGTELYLGALEAYHAEPDAYASNRLSKMDLSPAGLKKLKAVDLLLQASESGKATIFATKPERVVKYGKEQYKDLVALESLGKLTNNLGVRLRIAKRSADAKKFHEACFNLGYTMCAERVTYMEFLKGQELMQVAAIELATTDPGNAEQYNAVKEALSTLINDKTGKFVKYRDAIRTIDPRVIKNNAGDVFNLARNSQDRMWRVEAIMALGHLRYNAGSPGDQRGAEKLLKQMAADESLEPAAKAAAKAAANLTEAEHHLSAQM